MEGSLVNYYKKIAPSESTAQGISKEVIDNFIKSCGKIIGYHICVKLQLAVTNTGIKWRQNQKLVVLIIFYIMKRLLII